MPLSPPTYGPGLSPMVSPFTREGADAAGTGMMDNPTYSLTGLAATALQTAYYTPIVLPRVGLARKLWWLNGTTVGTHNIQVGVYADTGAYKPGAAIVRGTSTLSAGASVLQFDDITDTQMGPGLVWLAIWFSGTTPTVQATNTSFYKQNRAYLEASLAGGLPATATPATATNAFRCFFHGIQFRASP